MKRTGKFLSLLLALAMVCSLFVPAMAADEKKEEPAPYTIGDVKGKLVILHTNDTHGADAASKGRSIGTAGVAQMKKDFEAAGAEVILMSAGDAIMGNPLVSISKGASAIEFMNAAKYDVMTMGNHEMDFGSENLKTLVKTAKFPILGANVMDSATKKPLLDANKIITTASGLKVGVFGLATPETLTKADARKMPGITFAQDEELYKCAQAQVDELKKAGCEFIVCLSHLGVDEGSIGNRSCDMANKVTGIDLIVDGHSHTVMKDGKPSVKGVNIYPTFENTSKAPIVSTGTALANVGVAIYDKTAKTLTTELVAAANYTKTDADVAALVKKADDANIKMYGDKIATTEVDLNGGRSGGKATSTKKVDVVFPDGEGVRVSETNMGDFAADAVLWQARKVVGATKVDAALTNGGGIRETISKGDVSKLDLLSVFPFGNTVVTIPVLGADLLEALEAAAQDAPTASGSFAQVSGIEYVIKTAAPYEKGENYALSTFAAPAKPGSRVTILSVNGKAFDPAATYTIATNDFTAAGGDSYCIFKKSAISYTGKTLDEALIAYTAEELKGVIPAAKYAKPAGRVTVLPADIKVGAWYEAAAQSMVVNGTMKGTAANTFDPIGTITRGTIYQILFNLEGAPTKDIPASKLTDIEGKWYAPAANWAVDSKLLTGTEFKGEEVITRGELATIISKYAAMKGIKVATEGAEMKAAPDYATISAEHLDGMTFCFYSKVMIGDKAGNLNPMGQLTRGELAQVMYNFSKLPVPAAKAA